MPRPTDRRPGLHRSGHQLRADTTRFCWHHPVNFPVYRAAGGSRKENTQRVLYSGPGQRVLYAPFARFFGVILRAFNSPTVDCARFFTADSHTGEKQSLRKADKTLIVDFNLLTVLRVL